MSRYYREIFAFITAPIRSLTSNWGLINALVRRDFFGRYQGSMLGVLWSLFNPLLMLAIYTLVFSVAFKARWDMGAEGRITFSIILFSGIIVHSFFAECITRAPGIITGHAGYVKKVVFPLEILVWMTTLSAALHFLISFVVLLIFCALSGTVIHPEIILLPLILLPLLLMTVGVCWIIASLGVYLRDLSQITAMFSTVSLFLAPIFYPTEGLPPNFQPLLYVNPITLPVVQLRELLLFGKPLNWEHWAVSLICGFIIFHFGYEWFQKTRKGFADVV